MTNLNRYEVTGQEGEDRDSLSTFSSYPKYKDSGVEWLGAVPAHWQVQPLKTQFQVVGGSTPSADEEYWGGQVTWVTPADLSSLPSLEVGASARQITAKGLASCGATLVPSGSLVLSTRAPIGSLAIASVPLCTNQGCKTLVPARGKEARFFAYLLRNCTQALNVRGKGTTFLELSGDELSSFKVTVPPQSEQAIISHFLNHETARIDALVEEQQRLIELLKEKRQAVISHAVTKGLDANVPMKDSGVQWLGEVPEHWEVIKLGLIASEKCDGPFGSALKSEHYTDHGVRVIRLQNIKSGRYNDSDSAYIDEGYYNRSIAKSDVASGDVLIAGLGDERNIVGRACVAPFGIEPAMVKADCFRFRLIQDTASPEFVAEQLSSGAEADAGVMASGSTRSRIPLSTMSTRKVALPPMKEQVEICKHLRDVKNAFDLLSREASLAIKLLEERRSALISAAVTGKIDVRGWKAEQHSEQPEVLMAAEERVTYA
ncbi:restriction endonuclease subunit S [Chromohalobacter sarecensis]|uniref:Restriction endonuclease subunit S n=1 Tax=Chromohalobacter sarecensis TaxID=245294 RepID=A0ABV9D4A6_9GAMM|nr:restriction endonuclease subunit S [Chromohalobacter sarecensis]MCK0713920.1 restriction endonuclease subunit S [Chromohalobacter sarecensis]